MRRAKPAQGRRSLRRRSVIRRQSAGWLVFALSMPLLVKAIFSLWSGDAAMLGASSIGFLLMIVAGLLTRRGIHQELDLSERRFSGRRRWPYRTLAGAILALATGFTAFAAVGQSAFVALAYAIGAAAGYCMLYGLDPGVRRLGRLNPGDYHASGHSDEARGVLAAAYERVDSLEQTAAALAHREFRERLTRIAGIVHQILLTIEEDPTDLRRARKFLNVYLQGTQQVAAQYLRTEQLAPSLDREQNFRTLLVDIENTCHEQQERLLQHDVLDLDVQIEVLAARLRHEGVT